MQYGFRGPVLQGRLPKCSASPEFGTVSNTVSRDTVCVQGSEEAHFTEDYYGLSLDLRR